MKKYLEAGLAVNGHLWYVREGKALKAYAQKQGIDPCYFIDLIALFSPRVQLRQNLSMTLQYLRGEWAHNLLPNVKVAVSHYEKTGIIHGQKCQRLALLGWKFGDTCNIENPINGVIETGIIRDFDLYTGNIGVSIQGSFPYFFAGWKVKPNPGEKA